MKKSIVLFIGAIFLTIGSFAQTNISSSFSVNTTLTVANSPYVIVNSLDINAGVTVTIEKGVEVRFNSGRYLQVFGTLNAKGVKFTANGSTAKGFWDGIYVSYEYNSNIGNVILDSCNVEYASNLYARHGQLTLKKTTLNNFSGHGVQVSNLGALNIDNSVIKNVSYPIYLSGPGKIVNGGNNLLTGNATDYVYLAFNNIPGVFDMPNLGIPYYCNYMLVTETGTLNILPGTQLKFVNCEFTISGKIKALGTALNPIVFDMHPNASYWLGVNITANSIDTACVFKNCIFKNAQYDNEAYVAMEIDAASPTFENCKFTNNGRNLNVTGISKPTFTNCSFRPSTIQSGEAYNLGIDLNANIDFSTDSILFNTKEIRAVKILAATVIDDGHLKKLSFKNLDNPTYCMYGQTTVHDTASLVIDPGVVIKCRYYYSMLVANGTLTGIGTEAEPIVFTHIADDNFGNPKDSENNGQAAINNSNSGRIAIYGKSTSKIKNWKIYYGGYDSNNWAIYVSKGNIVENCEIKNSYRGIYYYDNAQILNNSFSNINYYPVGRYLTQGNTVLMGNTVSNVGYIGILITGIATDSPTLKPVDFAGVTNVAYMVDYDLNIVAGNVLNIDPGVVIKFYQYGKLTVNGAIKANGKKDSKIIFTSYNDDSASGDSNNNGTGSVPGNGDWGGIDYNGTASDVDNILKNCEIRYCGQWYYGRSAAIQITDCKVAMDSILVNFSNISALSIFGNANPVLTNSQLYNLGNTPIYMDLFSNPTLTGNKVANLPRIGIRIRGGEISGTIPVRSFAGYDNITYIIEEGMTVPNAKELIIPSGVTFKGSGVWYIRGKLSIQGTTENPVVFTAQEDDQYGNPKDLQQNGNTTPGNGGGYFIFYDESDDLSTIDHALFRYSATIPIQTTNASPKILNSTFDNIAFDGISLSGTSAPTINGCTFNNLRETYYYSENNFKFPFTTSLLSYPAEAKNNIISGTTGRAIRISDETLTKDVTLIKRDFAGITNIPYVFHWYTVGTGAKLTVSPGVICKITSNGYLNIQNGLIAKGGNTPDSTIVFTSDYDDFYGGDTYNNGDERPYYYGGSWRGINFLNESIDDNCILENCILKFASSNTSMGAITIANASPSIKNCLFESNYNGIVSSGTSLPKIINCDFVGTNPTNGYGVWNTTSTNIVTATGCWWNSNTGPKHASNPGGLGERVSDYVVYTPWALQLAKPVLGDVSMNGEVKPFDASLVLQHAAGNIVLTTKQQSVADVSGNGAITSYDASLILQYSVGLISKFDQLGVKSAELTSYASISYPNLISEPTKKTFSIPLTVTTAKGIKALDMKYLINQDHIKFVQLNKNKLPAGVTIETGFSPVNGEITITMASAYDLNLTNQPFVLEFEFKDSNLNESQFNLTTALANDYALIDMPGSATITNKTSVTGIGIVAKLNEPNVYTDQYGIHANFELPKSSPNFNVQVVDILGRLIYRKTISNMSSGSQKLDFLFSEFENLTRGIYILNLNADDFNYSKKLLIK